VASSQQAESAAAAASWVAALAKDLAVLAWLGVVDAVVGPLLQAVAAAASLVAAFAKLVVRLGVDVGTAAGPSRQTVPAAAANLLAALAKKHGMVLAQLGVDEARRSSQQVASLLALVATAVAWLVVDEGPLRPDHQ
jgi:hypothetical protein